MTMTTMTPKQLTKKKTMYLWKKKTTPKQAKQPLTKVTKLVSFGQELITK